MRKLLRRSGIALGSLVAAWLVVSLVAGVLFVRTVSGNIPLELITFVLGGLIYRDILRRDSASS